MFAIGEMVTAASVAVAAVAPGTFNPSSAATVPSTVSIRIPCRDLNMTIASDRRLDSALFNIKTRFTHK
jgi:hypothetical protein